MIRLISVVDPMFDYSVILIYFPFSMSTVVSILNPKGGVGRSTLATNLAGGLSEFGYKTLLVDADPQGSVVDWENERRHDWKMSPAVVPLSPDAEPEDLRKLTTGFDWVVVDTPAGLERLSLAALNVADCVLIPIRPSAPDLWATEQIVDLVKARLDSLCGTRVVPTAFVCLQVISGTDLAKEVDGAASSLGFPVLTARTTMRAEYSDAFQVGLTVPALRPGSEGDREVTDLLKEIVKLVAIKPKEDVGS